MKFLAPIRSAIERVTGMAAMRDQLESAKRSSWAQAWLRGQEDSIGGAQLTNALQQSVWVYACINTLADAVAHIPFRFSKGGSKPQRHRGTERGEKIVESGDIVTLFDRPHPYMDRFLFWELVMQWLMLRGKVFIVALDKSGEVLPVNRTGGRGPAPASLVIINPDRVTKYVHDHAIEYYRYSAGHHDPLPSFEFLPEEIICLRMANPYDFFEGLPPLGVAALAAQTDYAASQFMKGLMLNNADTGLIVTTDQQPTDEQRLAIFAAIKERKRKAGTADAPLMLWGGMKVEKPEITMVDLQFLDNRKFTRQEICAVFRVPQEVIGFAEDANRAVAETVRLQFIENRIAPLCERLESAVDPIVKAFGPDLFGFFDIDALPVMQNARRARYQSAVQGFTIGVPLNVLNEVFDLGLPGNLPHGGKSYLPFSLQEVGAGEELADEAPSSKPQAPNEEETEVDKIFRVLSKSRSRSTSKSKTEVRPVHQCAANPEYEAALSGSISNKKSKLKRFFFEQRGRVLAKLEDMDLTEALMLDIEAGAIASRAWEELFALSVENDQLMGRLRSLLIADLEFGGAQLFAEVGAVDFKLPPAKAIEFLKNRENKIQDINQTTFDKLKDSLSQGLQDGDTFPELRERVKEVFQNASDERAETIAVTETNTAVNGGRFEGMKQAQVTKKGWKTANLEGVRASHLQAERDYLAGIPLDQPFYVGGFPLMHPGDPKGPPQEVINCRCFTFAVIEGGKNHRGTEGQRRMLKYEEWLASWMASQNGEEGKQ